MTVIRRRKDGKPFPESSLGETLVGRNVESPKGGALCTVRVLTYLSCWHYKIIWCSALDRYT
jgi:hypothetical protein